MAIGEAGSIVASAPNAGDTVTVTFAEPLTDPVIALTGTRNDGAPYTLRVVDQTVNANGETTAFTFAIEEWEYLDGVHGSETINWLAVEEGVHTLPDGRVIEAGTSQISSTARNTGGNETFTANFGTTPVVLTSVMSNNDSTAVDSDPQNITTTGFTITLQEEEAQNGAHAAETIGWIAIEPGSDADAGYAGTLGGVTHNASTANFGTTFDDAVVLTDTQGINGRDTAREAIDSQTNSSASVFSEEERSSSNETSHIGETFAIVAFEDGKIPCFTSGTRIETPSGKKKIDTIKVGDRIRTLDNGAQKVRWVGKRQLSREELVANPKLYPVRISSGALGNGLPKNDLLVSQQHRFHLTSPTAKRMFGHDEVLIEAIRLTALDGVYIDTKATEVEYIHLLFDNHEIIFAEGSKTESLYLGPEATKALSPESLAEIKTLFPELIDHEGFHVEARYIPPNNRQGKFVTRHYRNRKIR